MIVTLFFVFAGIGLLGWSLQALWQGPTKQSDSLPHQPTTRAEAMEALARAEARYRGLFENAVEGMFQTTPEGQYLAANPALARMYGYESTADLIAGIGDIERKLYVDPQRRQDFI